VFPTAIFERFYILTPERKNCAAVDKELPQYFSYTFHPFLAVFSRFKFLF